MLQISLSMSDVFSLAIVAISYERVQLKVMEPSHQVSVLTVQCCSVLSNLSGLWLLNRAATVVASVSVISTSYLIKENDRVVADCEPPDRAGHLHPPVPPRVLPPAAGTRPVELQTNLRED